MKTTLTLLLLCAVLASCGGYRVKHEINEYKEENVFDNECNGKCNYHVFYDVWIYKGLKPIKEIGYGSNIFCEQDYKTNMTAINNEINRLEHIGDSLIKTVPKQ